MTCISIHTHRHVARHIHTHMHLASPHLYIVSNSDGCRHHTLHRSSVVVVTRQTTMTWLYVMVCQTWRLMRDLAMSMWDVRVHVFGYGGVVLVLQMLWHRRCDIIHIDRSMRGCCDHLAHGSTWGCATTQVVACHVTSSIAHASIRACTCSCRTDMMNTSMVLLPHCSLYVMLLHNSYHHLAQQHTHQHMT